MDIMKFIEELENDLPVISPATQPTQRVSGDLADERAGPPCGNPEVARKEVWFSWEEWKARETNREFERLTERKSNITPATVRHGKQRHDGRSHEV